MTLFTALSWTSQLAMLRLPLVLVDELNCPPRSILMAENRGPINESLRTNRDSAYRPDMVTLTPPSMPSALSSAWRNCERRCPKETALLVADFSAKMLDLEKRSEGAGIYRTLDAPSREVRQPKI